ncbi:MAG: integral membrane [Lasallia pustulata]|uniref:Integral membrane n=1 Tax=Lasallia pustulata TaxID=136370 RepID=A0A5M8PGK7_9LECA|nr:MAG: integral membrane [Lasallia pustulata]
MGSIGQRAIGERDIGLHGRGMVLVVVSIAFDIIGLCLVITRAASRLMIGRSLGKDDYTIIVSMCFSIAMGIANCVAVDHGYGKMSTTLSPHDLKVALKMFWLLQIFYKCTITLTKISILLLYLRIFPKKSFRWAVYAVMGFVISYAISSIAATILQCHPIERVFNHKLDGKCINLTVFWYCNAAASILSDCLILALPMPLITSLHLPRRQKYGLMMVFALGGFVCVTSVLRMTTLNPASKSADQTYGTLISTTWTTIEAGTGIICACLPMLKAPLTLIFPRLLLNSSNKDAHGSQVRPAHHARRDAGHESMEQNKKKASTFENWGRPESNEDLIPVPALNSVKPRTMEDQSFGKNDGKNIPMGIISKTTDVSVCYDDHDSIPGSDISHMTIPTVIPSRPGGGRYVREL